MNLVGTAIDVNAPAAASSDARIHNEMLAVLSEVRGNSAKVVGG